MAVNFSYILSALTLAGDAVAIWLIALLFVKGPVQKTVARYAMWAAMLIAAGGTLASLFYSEILRYAPCNLCWYQRIALYPQIILLGVAMWHKDRRVMRYIAWLSAIGAAFALYNHGLQMSWFQEGALCGLSATVSCAKIYALEFGFITIPFMAFTGFILNLLLSLHVLRTGDQ